jgi:hypothetical protein
LLIHFRGTASPCPTPASGRANPRHSHLPPPPHLFLLLIPARECHTRSASAVAGALFLLPWVAVVQDAESRWGRGARQTPGRADGAWGWHSGHSCAACADDGCLAAGVLGGNAVSSLLWCTLVMRRRLWRLCWHGWVAGSTGLQAQIWALWARSGSGGPWLVWSLAPRCEPPWSSSSCPHPPPQPGLQDDSGEVDGSGSSWSARIVNQAARLDIYRAAPY